MMDIIAGNLEFIKKEIAAAAGGRKVLLLPATKTVGIDIMQRLPELGIGTVGENRVQELLSKYEVLRERLKFHFIGKLQTNKVKYIIDKVELIHSVDSLKLAAEIDRQAKKINKIMDILIEINIGGEKSKSGIAPEECEAFLKRISEFTNIKVRGLMAIPPFMLQEGGNNEYFKEMYKIYVDNGVKNLDNISMDFLSMGMSQDYKDAVRQGANIVRIGMALFGIRN